MHKLSNVPRKSDDSRADVPGRLGDLFKFSPRPGRDDQFVALPGKKGCEDPSEATSRASYEGNVSQPWDLRLGVTKKRHTFEPATTR